MDAETQGTGPRELEFEFRGDGLEYFKIWVVNLFLSIITLGIYSAWAKVRNTKYFYNNFYLDNQNFDYHANPLAILLGRAIAVGVFLILTGVSQVYPLWGGIIYLVVFLPLIPLLVIKSLRFRNRNSSYRNIRFDFVGNYLEAVLVWVVLPIAGMLTVGLLTPYALYRIRRYIVENTSYGTTFFEFDIGAGEYYWTVLKILLIIFAVAIGAGIAMTLSPILGVPLLLLAYPFFFALYEAAIGNLQFNSTLLGMNNFVSNLDAKELAIIYATNVIGLVLTLGLFLPVAKVRVARYRAAHLTFVAGEDLERFVAKEMDEVNAIGEELGEFLDFNLGF